MQVRTVVSKEQQQKDAARFFQEFPFLYKTAGYLSLVDLTKPLQLRWKP